MACVSDPDQVYGHITLALAEVLSHLRDGRRLRAISDHRGVELSTTRKQTEQLEQITGCHSLAELADWWRQHDREWLSYVASQAKVPFP